MFNRTKERKDSTSENLIHKFTDFPRSDIPLIFTKASTNYHKTVQKNTVSIRDKHEK